MIGVCVFRIVTLQIQRLFSARFSRRCSWMQIHAATNYLVWDLVG